MLMRQRPPRAYPNNAGQTDHRQETLKTQVRAYGRPLKKSLGQVFLIEKSIREKICEIAKLDPCDVVVEIGPGTGSLTASLAKQAHRLFALEIDKELIGYLKTAVSAYPNVYLICIDALRFDFHKLGKMAGRKLKVIGNVPYSISTPLIFHMIESRAVLECVVIMLQKELAQRLIAQPGTKDYGVLTIMTQAYMDVALARYVPRECFHPKPRVDSALVRLTPKVAPLVPLPLHKTFSSLVTSAFQARRKTLFNAVRTSKLISVPGHRIHSILTELAIDPMRRAETISIEEFVLIAQRLQEDYP